MNWTKDKDALTKWLLGTFGACILAGGGMLWAHEGAIERNATDIRNNRERTDRTETRNDSRLQRIEDKIDRMLERITP